MCSPLKPLSCPDAIARGIADKATEMAAGMLTNNLDTILSGLTRQLHVGIEFLSIMLARWILIGSTQVCATTGNDWVATCASGTSPAAQVRGWMLPVTALVAVLGIVWQAITMTITRKGEPLLIVLKGLFATAVWGALGIAGTQLALRAGDSYAFWILQQAIFGDSLHPADDLGTAIASMSAGESYTAVLVLLLLQVPFFIVTLAQIILMIFREGAVVILAGQLQLAAAGGFTRLTSGWLAKVTGWMLALIAYKPIAATIYALAFALMGDGVRNLIMGLTVMVMALIAMPVLMKFFNWSVGSIGAANTNSLSMLGTGVAAGLHGASAMHTMGGHRAADHASYLDRHGPGAPTTFGRGGGISATGGGGYTGSGAGSLPATPAGGSSPAAAGSSGGAAGAASGGVTLAAQAAADTARQAKRYVERGAGAAGDAMRGV